MLSSELFLCFFYFLFIAVHVSSVSMVIFSRLIVCLLMYKILESVMRI